MIITFSMHPPKHKQMTSKWMNAANTVLTHWEKKRSQRKIYFYISQNSMKYNCALCCDHRHQCRLHLFFSVWCMCDCDLVWMHIQVRWQIFCEWFTIYCLLPIYCALQSINQIPYRSVDRIREEEEKKTRGTCKTNRNKIALVKIAGTTKYLWH